MKYALPVSYSGLNIKEKRLVREQYISEQKGVCYFCKQSLEGKPSPKVLSKKINHKLFPEGFFNFPVHLHHSHDTDMTLGAVHNYCNAVLWQYYGE